MSSRTKVFNMLFVTVLYVMTYESETWTLTKSQERKLRCPKRNGETNAQNPYNE